MYRLIRLEEPSRHSLDLHLDAHATPGRVRQTAEALGR